MRTNDSSNEQEKIEKLIEELQNDKINLMERVRTEVEKSLKTQLNGSDDEFKDFVKSWNKDIEAMEENLYQTYYDKIEKRIKSLTMLQHKFFPTGCQTM